MKDKEISVQLTDINGFRQDFKSLRALYNFAKKELQVWSEHYEAVNAKNSRNISDPTLSAHNYFKTLVNTIDSWQDELDKWDDSTFQQKMIELNQNSIRHLSSRWLWSGDATSETFVNCFLEHNEQTAAAFLKYVTKRQVVTNQNNIDSFNGAMLGYEFVNQASEITKRRNGEKVSLGHLRNSFADAKNELFSEVEDLKRGINEWDEDTRLQFNRLFRANKYLGERRIKQHNKQFDEKLHDWSSAIGELEKTYEEKLRLKKPAEYWEKSASKYGRQAMLWTLSIVALSVLGLVYFREFFVTWLQGQETDVKLNTIQGVILFGSFAAAFAYLMKVLSRLAFSSFHLMRDAEEREQLTYLYLSLINESELDKDARDIVLQALFSRTETGLLQQEHGPTMPGVGEIVKNLSKGRS